MKHFNLGLIGLGGMAQAHIRGFRDIGHVSIKAIADVNAAALDKVGEQLDIPPEKRYKDFHELIHDADIDAVVSVTPNDIHAEIIKSCLAAGKPFFAEKPFTRTYVEASELIGLYEKAPVPCMINFSYRYTPAFRYVRELLRQGKIGTVRHLSVQYLQEWGTAAKNTPFLWRFDKKVTGTGTLGDLGSHMIDMAHYLVGDFAEVSAQLHTIVPERKDPGSGEMIKVDVDDFASFQARLANDVMGVFQTSRNAIGSGNQHEVSLYGDSGTIHASTENPDKVIWIHEDPDTNKIVRSIIDVPDRVKTDQWADFAAVLAGSPPDGSPGFMDGYRNQQVLEAIVQSHQSKRTVMLKS